MPLFNPFPGLRAFEPDEDHLFFGREKEIDELLRRLRTSRFVAVVGTSGSGKSSLVRSGMIPSLESGFMAGAGSSWRIAVLRPGEDPIGHLASALDAALIRGGDPELVGTSRLLLEVTLRRGTLGLVDAVRQARLPAGDNVLLIVDQFEELFRFRNSRQIANSRDDAIAFVKLLLEAAAQQDLPIYVVLTMRSDFIGDCMAFPGLPEAVNDGLYLVGRMPRDSVRLAITGPVAVAGGAIAPRLVIRILNALGDDNDQLPLVQHALMRTWDHWAARQSDGPIDVEDYEAVGAVQDALSKHAEEAYDEASTHGFAKLAEDIFEALTDTFTDPRGVRRPTAVRELADITGAAEEDVIRVVEIFRKPGRTFLMPPPTIPLTGSSIVDLSHESLMRGWRRLIEWAEQERDAAEFYTRLSQAAAWYERGSAGLWRNPELELAQQWKAETKPTAAWAGRYDSSFERALAFLDTSLAERERLDAERERERRTKLRRTQLVAGALATLLTIAVVLGTYAWNERRRAQHNLDLARQAVDESLAAADRDPSQIAADTPQVQELRRELLSRAERFYLAFLDQEPRSEQSRRDVAIAHLRFGDINRMLEKRDEAEREYRRAIAGLTALTADNPRNAGDRRALAGAYNSLGETLRLQVGRADDAAPAYDAARQIQQALVQQDPGATHYREELARTLSNRGILRSSDDGRSAESDFRESMRLLEPLTAGSQRALQEIGRVANNLAAMLDSAGAAEARAFYERAVAGHERLVQRSPDNREYQLELATFCNNLAVFLHDRGERAAANARSRQAVALMTGLARPAPSLAIERADAYTLQGMILQAENIAAAARAYEDALQLFAEIEGAPGVLGLPAFHRRFGDLLVNLAALSSESSPVGRRVLLRALDQYVALATRAAASGAESERRAVLDTLARVAPDLGDRDRRRLLALQEQLRLTMEGRGPSSGK
ncbi:MAG TPA: hypothetical protein VMN81_06820 [Vicinamibacterales bacterium]|nr:hypothetical protein [Vicinamibacterales bacterium]